MNLELSLEAESDLMSMGNITVPFIPWEYRLGEGHLVMLELEDNCTNEEVCMQEGGEVFLLFDLNKCMGEMVVYSIFLVFFSFISQSSKTGRKLYLENIFQINLKY